MPETRLAKLARRWRPDSDDADATAKSLVVQLLLDQEVTSDHPMTITEVMNRTGLTGVYTRESFQHAVLGPLRRDPKVFVGTSSRGIFLVTRPEDVNTTLGFYTWRVRAELRHARNLRSLAKRAKVFDGQESRIPEERERAVIFLDESGNPDVAHMDPPVFVVAAVLVESRRELATIDRRFRNACEAARRPPEQELKTSGLSTLKHATVLHELSLLDYQWAAACFDKAKLTSAGFAKPKTFYKYAFQFLVGELLTLAWQSDLVIDQHASDAFQTELSEHLRRQNSGLPVRRLTSVSFADSSKSRLVQLADLVAGAVRRAASGDGQPLREIEHKMINLHYWPPR